MFYNSADSFCRSEEYKNGSQHTDVSENYNQNLHTRYKILFYMKDLNPKTDKVSLNWIKIVDLSGDVDQLSEEKTSEEGDELNSSGLTEGSTNQKNDDKESFSFDPKNIQNCFKKKDEVVIDSALENVEQNSKIWGKLLGNLKGYLSTKPHELKDDEDVYLKVGPYVLRGNKVEFRKGEYFVIVRKVPDHCSCVCSESNLNSDTHTSHSSYYEICGVVNEKIDFKSRPNFYSSVDESELEEYYFYLSNCKNSNWFILKVDDEILNKILQEEAYFKLINTGDNDENNRAVMCIRNNTYYIERIELGGTLMLFFSLSELEEGTTEEDNLLVVAGSTKYAYNLVKSNPIFEQLPKAKNIHISTLFDQTPISDLEIVDFVLGKYEAYPCYYLFQNDVTMRYMGQYFFGEFAVRVIQVIPMYFSNNPKEKKAISELTVGDLWKMMNLYSDIFEFVPNELFNMASLFQIILQISDVYEAFETIESYLGLMKKGSLCNFRFNLNLFKIQKLVSWCLVSANYHKDISYQSYAYYLDDLLYNKAVPSYVFEELLDYLCRLPTNNQQMLDYKRCIEFYYKNLPFSEVSNLLCESERMNMYENKTLTIFDRTGMNLFTMEDLEFSVSSSHKLPCLNYDIYKIDTKGLTNLRFGYSMNSLLSICRCPLSLHIAYLSEKLVCVTESNRCVLKIYPMNKYENLRDMLSKLFSLRNTWHLEVLENKLVSYFEGKPAIDTLTGAPDYHGRLLITKEINSQNYKNKNVVMDFKHETVEEWKRTKVELKPIKEETYMIINWNVPI